MVRIIKENWALFAGMLMLMMANGLLSTLLTIQGSENGFSATTIGLMQAGYPLGALLGSTLAPKLVERAGHVRSFGALASLCSISAVVHLITTDPLSWGIMRLLAGFCFPGLYVIAESWLNTAAESRSRGTVLSVYFIVQSLGSAVGQSFAGFDDPGGTVLFGLTSILISLSLVPLLLSRNPAPDYVPPERLKIRQLARISPMAVFGTVLNGAAQAAFYIALPLYGLTLGMSSAEAASLLVVGTVSGALAQFPVGWISDRMDRRLVAGGISALCAVICAAVVMGVFGEHVFVAVALIAACTLPVYAICVAHVCDQLKPSQIVPASGTLVLMLNVGILFGAFAGPYVIGLVGPSGLMMMLGTLSASIVTVAFVRRAQEDAPQSSVAAQPIAVQGTQTIGAMHPYSEAPQEER